MNPTETMAIVGEALEACAEAKRLVFRYAVLFVLAGFVSGYLFARWLGWCATCATRPAWPGLV